MVAHAACLYPRQFPGMDTTSVKGCKLALDNFSSFSGSVYKENNPAVYQIMVSIYFGARHCQNNLNYCPIKILDSRF